MKRLFYYALPALLLALALQSCVLDRCRNTNCQNGGVCEEGTCQCPSGFEGANCEKRERDKFTGRYFVTYRGRLIDGNQFGTHTRYDIDTTVSVNLAADYNTDGVTIPNVFLKPGQNMRCTVSGTTLHIPTGPFTVCPRPGLEYSFNFISMPKYYWANGNSMSATIDAVNLSAGTDVNLEVILTPR
jgi:hypothetical protein